MYEDHIASIERMKINLTNYATGGNVNSEFKYKEERMNLMNNSIFKEKVPMFIKTCRSVDEFWGYIKPKFSTYHERRTFIASEFHELLTLLEEMQSRNIAFSNIIEIPLHPGSEISYIHETWNKAIERTVNDPEGAITIARTLLEEIFKYILVNTKTSYSQDADLPSLYKLVRNLLNLSPEQHTEEIFKQILGGCNSVVVGLGSLRSKHGDAHGKTPYSVRPERRHAKLAVNLAGAMGEFIMNTYLEKVVLSKERA
ncbi:abortive infection family protein [Sporosarcina gallistercoris]|uniref:abortive infection family protein n=1 Tax=Sporosarcina gallistercoris TaxID=2762245 RepID=UPI003D2D7335